MPYRKSQLAIEYTYQIRSTSPETWVFWIHSSNQARFEQSFRALAEQLKLPGRQDPRANIFQLVENWLRDEKKGKWICVLDNVDDESLCSPPEKSKDGNNQANVPQNAPVKPLLEYVPRSPHGSTIITSRSKEVALKMVDHRDLVEVKPMEAAEGLDLFQKKLGPPEKNEVISPEEAEMRKKLVEALEFMPLAIVQAASHIRKRKTRYSVAQYLTDLQSDREAIKLLKKSVGFTYRDWEASNSILATWEISFDHIRRTKPSAADLLSIMCFFDRQSIPEILIQDRPEVKGKSSSQVLDDSEPYQSESDDAVDFEEDVATLTDYAFISVNEDSTFTMHRLVQLSTRAWLKSHGQIECCKYRCIKNLAREFPHSVRGNETWSKCQILWPHVISAMSQRPDSGLEDPLREWARLLFLGASYADSRGWFNEMLEMAFLSRKCRMELVGAQDEVALARTAILWKAYMLRDERDQAEDLLMQDMAAHKCTSDEKCDFEMGNMTLLAMTYRVQGRLKEAEELEVQCLAANKTRHGENHPNTLLVMAALATTYSNQGRWEEAERLFMQAIENRKKSRQCEDCSQTGILCLPLLDDLYDGLALVYAKQGRWEETEKLQVVWVEKEKTTLGEDHHVTLGSMASLARTYARQGRLRDAEGLFVQAAKGQKIKLGKDHSDTLASISDLAIVYMEQGRLEKARQMQVHVMEAYKARFGENHPHFLNIMDRLATVYRMQGNLTEAEDLSLQVMEGRKMMLGADHPETLMSITDMALVYRDQGRLEEAMELIEQGIEVQQMKLGKDHPQALITMISLASIYLAQEKWEESEQLYLQVVQGLKNKIGENHVLTVSTMCNLAVVWKFSGRDNEAIDLLRDCAIRQRETIGPDHPDTQHTFQVLLEWETANLNISS